jgi:hypothetical protein
MYPAYHFRLTPGTWRDLDIFFTARNWNGTQIMVVAFINHTEFPDGSQAIAAEIKKLPDVPIPVMSKLLELLLAAQTR